jgi:hypothetical protein
VSIKSGLILLLCMVMVGLLIFKEERIPRPAEPVKEGCLFCHQSVTDSDPSHPFSAFGCATCHMGNAHALDKERAHVRMVLNPGDLRVAGKTCGKPQCHPEIVPRVKKSVMATNRGIIGTLTRQWRNKATSKDGSVSGESDMRGIGVRALYTKAASGNLAMDQYRKMCGGCHLWKERGDRAGEIGRRGGGCSDCHVLDHDRNMKKERDPSFHPKITTRIPSENCVKCHNRSARIGLSYFGKFESAGYGTPYRGSHLSNRRLSGNRFYMNLQADIHYQKARMDCIDCHTATGIMGDGKTHERMETQTDITCISCHKPTFNKAKGGESLTQRLISLNRYVPGIQGKDIALSKKGTPLYNVQREVGRATLYRKRDGKPFDMKLGAFDTPHHTLKGHDRLSCQACHSAWIPQCYGCHLTYRKSKDQRDWISNTLTPGRWKESRSYVRFSTPTLGVRGRSGIFPLSPCQVFVSYFDAANSFQKERSFKTVNLSAFDPHTTSTASRPCLECHGDPKALGLGEGRLFEQKGEVTFRATYDAPSSGIGLPFALDAFVNILGQPLQRGAWGMVRPFNREEMEKILYVGQCAGCHALYKDPIYTDFPQSKQRFETEAGIPCLR